MIITDGKVVFEWGKTINNIYSHSTRKSLLSALYGIYVADGKIDPSVTIGQIGIEENIPLTDTEKQAKIIDLLKARSGVYIPAAAETRSMKSARPKRGGYKPGTNWYYNNWDFNVLGTIFKQLTGEGIYEAFKKRIAEPIGMEDYIFEKQNYSYEQNFSIHPAYPFLISARDMARVGQLFLQEGQWKGKQIIPADWIRESTRSYSDTGKAWRGYGYMWWTIEDDHRGLKKGDYYASGYGGQNLFVLPRINTVIVHRVNIYLPGIDVGRTGNAPFLLMPKIMRAYTGQRKQVVPVLAGKMAPQRHLLPDYVYIMKTSLASYKEMVDARRQRIAWAWLVLVAVSAVVLIWDQVRGTRASWPVRLLWLLVIILFGPFGLLAYYLSYRQPLRSPNPPAAMTNWRCALYASVHSVAGYIVAILLTIAYFVLIQPNANWMTILPVSYLAPLFIGLMVFRAPFVVRQTSGRYWLAVRRALLVEVISVNLVFTGFGTVFIFLRYRFFPGPLEMVTPLFWLTMSLAVIAGALILYPFNAWICRRGFSSVLVRHITDREVTDEKMIEAPNFRKSWYVLVLSIILLLVSVYLTVLQIPS